MQRIPIDQLGDLFQQPWLATLATYRKDGTVLLSPVWFEWDGEAFLVSLVHGDWKELHLRRNPRVSPKRPLTRGGPSRRPGGSRSPPTLTGQLSGGSPRDISATRSGTSGFPSIRTSSGIS